MAKTAILSVKIISDAKKAIDGFDQAGTAAGKFETNARKAALGAGVVGAALIALGKQAADAAGKLEQSTGAVETVFGDQADAVKALAAGAAEAVGLSMNAYSELAAGLGGQLKGLGIAENQIVDTTDALIRTGADLAATYGGTTADAVSAFGSLLRGEADPIERYNVFIKQSDVNARLAADGLKGLTGEALKQAETQARLAMVTEQTGLVTGKFAEEAGTAAGATQIATAQWENMQATLGVALLPLLVMGAQLLGEFATWVMQNNDAATVLLTTLGIMVLAILALNLAMMANPIAIVIGLLVGFVAMLVTAYNTSDEFRAIIDGISDSIAGLLGWLGDAIGALGQFLGLSGQASSAGGEVSAQAMNAPAGLQAQPMTMMAAPMTMTAMAAPSSYAMPAALTAGGSSSGARLAGSGPAPATVVHNHTYNITGALDPSAVGRQIRDLVSRADRLEGKAVFAGATA